MVLCALGLSGCAVKRQGPYPGHSADWFLKHGHDAHMEYNWCQKHDPAHEDQTCSQLWLAMKTEAQEQQEKYFAPEAIKPYKGPGIVPGNLPDLSGSGKL
jgi:hypothetical protein